MLVVDRAAVVALLPLEDAIAVMRAALAAFARGQAFQPPRALVAPPNLEGIALIKPAALFSPAVFGMKVLTEFPANRGRKVGVLQGAILLFDPETGSPSAVVEASSITSIRTAAVSAVATDLLATDVSSTVAILGAGVQARSHLRAMSAVRTIRDVRVWNRSPQNAHDLVAWARDRLSLTARVIANPREAVDGADLICTVTDSPEPLIERVDPGAHVNAVGAYKPTRRELSTAVVVGATIVVDSRESALAEAGDLLIPVQEGAMPLDRVATAPELGELITGAASGRRTSDEVTLFKSLGLALEDIAAAAIVVERARQDGAGTEVPFL